MHMYTCIQMMKAVQQMQHLSEESDQLPDRLTDYCRAMTSHASNRYVGIEMITDSIHIYQRICTYKYTLYHEVEDLHTEGRSVNRVGTDTE